MKSLLEQAGTRPDGRYDMRRTNTKHFHQWEYSTIFMCRMGRWWFWSRCDLNRPTFDEDIHEKRFLHFRSHSPGNTTFWSQICSSDYCWPAQCFHWVRSFTTLLFRENRGHGTEKQTDGMRPPREGRVTSSFSDASTSLSEEMSLVIDYLSRRPNSTTKTRPWKLLVYNVQLL